MEILQILLNSDAFGFISFAFMVCGTIIIGLKINNAHELLKIEKLALLKASTEIDQEIKNELAKLE